MIRERLRRAGAGRLLYRSFYRPLQNVDLARAYGWRMLWRHRQGLRAMRRAARRLPDLPDRGRLPLPVPVSFLTGTRLVHQTLFCAHSLARHAIPPALEFISDGSLRREDEFALPGVSVRRGEAVEAAVAAALPPARFPELSALRRSFVLLRKLTDTMAGRSGYRLLLDSDMLFWLPPTELIARAAAGEPFFLADIGEEGYSASRAELNRRFGVEVAPGVNSGLVGLFADRIDWDLLERACGFLRSGPGDQRLLEQTLWAIALGAQSARPLDAANYRVVIDPPACAAAIRADPPPVLLHYAWRARLVYEASEWRRYLEGANP